MEMLPIEKISPDPNQPRKYFAADKLFQLKESIKKHGIITPLNVMAIGDGTYLLIDGERRYRAATELGVKNVPVTIEEPQKDEDRLIRQFQIQEYHEAWTPLEKAQSIIGLAESMSLTLQEICYLLGVSKRDTLRYVAFAELADKEQYVKSETPLTYAEYIKPVRTSTKRLSEDELMENFTKQDEALLEGQIIKLIKKGAVTKRSQVTKIGDAFKKDPKLIRPFLESEDPQTPEQLFINAKAKGAHALRNFTQYCRYICIHGNVFLQERDVKISPDQFEEFLKARDVINKMIDLS